MKVIIGLVVVGVALAVVIGLFATSQPSAAKDYCNDLDDLQASITSLTSLDPATATADEFETDVDAVRNSWTDVKGSAQSLSDVNMDSLDDAWGDFSQTVGSLGGNASVSDAEQAISRIRRWAPVGRTGEPRLVRLLLMAAPGAANRDEAPARAGLVLAALILVAGVANLNLSVANVALPDIGKHFDSSQTTLDLIAVGYSLGLAASVLYLGALGDRYGRKLMLLLGMALSVPACLLAAFAPTDEVLFIARVIGGLSAGMAYPTTLALIAALVVGTRAHEVDRPVVGARRRDRLAGAAGLGRAAGAVRVGIGVPGHPAAGRDRVPDGRQVRPGARQRDDEAVDNPGGILSVVLVAALILSINFAPVPNKGTLAIGLAAIAAAALIGFYIRQRRAQQPAVRPARRRAPDLLGRGGGRDHRVRLADGRRVRQPAVPAERARLLDARSGRGVPAAIVFMVLVAPRSAKLVESRGARFTLLCGYVSLLLAFATMLLLWDEGVPYWKIGLAYVFIGIGVGFAGTPASHSLTGSVPVQRAGMASGTADLQRDLGGAIMQSVFGALLTAGYAAAAAAAIAAAPSNQAITDSENQLTKSFAGAEAVAEQYPQYAAQITAAARQSFLDGDQWAYTAGIVAVVLGALLVFFMFPKKDEEQQTPRRLRSGGRRPGRAASTRRGLVAQDLAGFVGSLGRDHHVVGGTGSGDRGHPARLHDARDAALLQPLPDQVGHRLVVGAFHGLVVAHGVLLTPRSGSDTAAPGRPT